MSEPMILLFSSDYYPVFRQDVFAITSLPSDYCYHFRYKEKYVSQEIVKRVSARDTLAQAPALVIFVHNNKDKTNGDITFKVIRRATIVKVTKDTDTDLYHVYFKLAEFVDIKEDVTTFEASEIPQKTYLGWRVVAPGFTSINWSATVSKFAEIKELGNELFFHVKIEDENQKELDPKTRPHTLEPYFEITEGKSYVVRMKISDTTANKKTEQNEIKVAVEGTDITTNMGYTIVPGVDIDERYFRLTGLLLGDISSPINVLRISAIKKPAEGVPEHVYYRIMIQFDVIKDPNRLWTYFGTSIFVFLGGGLIAVDLSKITSITELLISLKIVGLLMAAGAAARLFYLFNKK